jgi:dienelactone hydrolase
VKRAHASAFAARSALAACLGCLGACANTNPAGIAHRTPETVHVQLEEGAGEVDVYWPSATTPAPMVVIAHGFSRSRHNMSGWGQHLANAGFVAVVPDLPALSDHARNGRFLSDLRLHFSEAALWKLRLDPSRVALMGFSAGGLSSLLAAAEAPGVALWIGLDPVDQGELGVKAANRLKSRAVVITAEPSPCNAHGNAKGILAALPRGAHFRVAGAVHVDAEWPTSWLAEIVCGRSTEDNRAAFVARATQALHEALAEPALQAERPGLAGAIQTEVDLFPLPSGREPG